MDYFAVGGRPLLSGRLYPSIFDKNRLNQVIDVPEIRHRAPEAPGEAGEWEDSTAFPRAPSALHKGFDASTVEVWESSRYEAIRKLQDASRNRGQVHLMKDRHTDRLVAVKVMPTKWVRNCHTDFVVEHPMETEMPWQDVGCVKFLNTTGYPYACTLLGVYRDAEEHTYVVTSLATEGDLFSWCETGCLPGVEREDLVRPLAGQIFRGIQELHDLCIAHRDLSLENILLSRPEDMLRQGSCASVESCESGVEGGDPRQLEIRIIDFSMASTTRLFRRCVRGKASYQAPEVHTDQEYDAFLSDSFALGVTIYAVVMKDYPWLSTRPGGCKCFEYVRQHGFRAYLAKRKLRASSARVGDIMSEPLKQLLEGLLSLDPASRLTLGERCFGGDGDEARRSVWDEPWLQEGA